MRRKFKKGFTLLEIIISLGLMAIILIPTSNMVLGAVKGNKAGENKQQASMLLQETAEYIRTTGITGDRTELPNKVVITRDSTQDKQMVDESGNVVLGKDNLPIMVPFYKVENQNDPSEYGLVVDGGIYVSHTETKIDIPGTAGQDVLGQSNMNVILKFEDGKILVTEGSGMALEDAISSNEGFEEAASSNNNNVNTVVDGNKGIIKINGKDYTTHVNTRKILLILEDEADMANVVLTVNGSQAVDIYLYIKDDSGNYKTTDEYFNRYVNVVIGNNNVDKVTYNRYVLNKVINDMEEAGWDNGGANSITVLTSYKVDLKALKNNQQVDSMALDILK